MLTPAIQKELITKYLYQYLTHVENDVNGYVPQLPKSESRKINLFRKKVVDRKNFTLGLFDKLRSQMGMGRESEDSVQKWAAFLENKLKGTRMSLALRKTDSAVFWEIIERRISNYNSRIKKKKDKIDLIDEEKTQLYLEFLKAEIQILEVQHAAALGDVKPLRKLKESVDNDLNSISKNRITFSKVIDSYQDHYRESKTHVKIGTIKDMEVECEMLLDIIGDTNITDVNSMKTLTRVKSILGKYPRNKKQVFGNASIHDILKKHKDFVLISKKTANEPLKRLRDIIKFAIKADYISTENKVDGDEFFKIDTKGKPRKSYDTRDIERLVDALCTKPLWKSKPPRDERFWVILIALFHGFRLGNIVNLTKKHIHDDENGWPCFDLRMFKDEDLLKTKNAAILVPMHEGLLLIGFMEWVNKTKSNILFADTSSTFSKWYNRREERSLGFEARYVTDDPDKCLHSARHYFSNDLRKSGIEHKMIKELMGHARVKEDVTSSSYLDRSETYLMKQALDKMKLEGIDINRLEIRARELFGFN